MQFRAFEPDIEISGDAVAATLEGFQLFPSVAIKYLARHGFGRAVAASVGTRPQWTDFIDRNAWYSQVAWLATFEAIAREVGSRSLYGIGLCIPENARFPPHITDIHSAIKSLDVAFHMNHRKNGRVMYDLTTHKMLEGIGHYGYRSLPREKKIVVVCENPYACDFDHGIVTAMARRFEPKATVLHDDAAPCRKKMDDSCTYVITW